MIIHIPGTSAVVAWNEGGGIAYMLAKRKGRARRV